MMRTVDKHWTLAIVLALGALCFSQLMTVAHVHHSHDGEQIPFEVSFHPFDFDTDLVPGHHGDDDHHHEFDRDYSQRFLTRGQQTGLAICQATPGILPSGIFAAPRFVGARVAMSQWAIPDDQTTRYSSDPRSPPLIV